MNNNKLEAIKEVILERRTVKPILLNGRKIPDEQVHELLALADWAPTHANTEPWYFVVYAGDKVNSFCHDHAELYKSQTPADKFILGNYEKLGNMGQQASHIIVACMKRGDNPKIPELEEIAAASCAVQNILLGATAMGISTYWGSGGMAYHPIMKKYLGLGEHDKVLGILYLGYTLSPTTAGRRIKPVDQKISWHQ